MNNEQEWRQHALNLTHTFPYTVRSPVIPPMSANLHLHTSACLRMSRNIIFSTFDRVLLPLYTAFFVHFCVVFEIVFIVNGIRHYNFKLCKRILLIWNLKFNGVEAEATTSYTLPPTVYSEIRGFGRSFFFT